MQGRATDHRNIDLREFTRDVIRGKSNGKIVWQPRMDAWYLDRKFDGRKMPGTLEGKSLPDVYRDLGCTARCYEYTGAFKRVYPSSVNKYTKQTSNGEVHTYFETPVGTIYNKIGYTSSTWAPNVIKNFITCEDDMKIAIWLEEHCDWEWDEEEYQKTFEIWGDRGAPAMIMPRTNIAFLYLDTMDIISATYALEDYPDTVEKYFAALDSCHERLIEVINRSPIEVINFGDNLHYGIIPPDKFVKYILPAYQKRNELLHKAGKFTTAHWDGEVRGFLPFAKQTGLDGIEALTPKPQGDVTLEEMKEALGDDIFLLDGIAAILFDEYFTLEELEAQTRKVIELFAPKLILGISDEISSTGDIERVRFVGKIVDDYNASISGK